MNEDEKLLALAPSVRFGVTMAMLRREYLAAALKMRSPLAREAVREFADSIGRNLEKCGLDEMGLPKISLSFGELREAVQEAVLEDDLQKIIDGLPKPP
jgi:hypothetical protein